jgi:hypothetical protein
MLASRLALIMATACALLGALFVPTAQAQLPSGQSVHIDGIVAIAGANAPGADAILILHSDVELRARLSLLTAGAPNVAAAPLPEALLSATLSELLGEALIAVEARRLNLATPDAATVQRARLRLVASAGGTQRLNELMRALGVAERELMRIVERRAVVSAFLDANLEGVTEITQAELERAYQTEEHPFRDQPLDQSRDALKSWLAQKRLESAVSRWVESLKKRTPYRVLVSD